MQRSALCRCRRELSNEYLLATFGFDTDENEPQKVRKFELLGIIQFELKLQNFEPLICSPANCKSLVCKAMSTPGVQTSVHALWPMFGHPAAGKPVALSQVSGHLSET